MLRSNMLDPCHYMTSSLRYHVYNYMQEKGQWCFDNKIDHTIHLALIRKDDLPAATWWIDGQGLLEALLNIWAPHALCVILQGFVKCIPQLLTPTPGGGSRHPLCRRGGTTERGPEIREWRSWVWEKGGQDEGRRLEGAGLPVWYVQMQWWWSGFFRAVLKKRQKKMLTLTEELF